MEHKRERPDGEVPKALNVVIFDNGDGSGTADKTLAEIQAAHKNGSAILGRIDAAGQTGIVQNLMTLEEGVGARVSGLAADGSYWAAMVTENEGVLVGNTRLVPKAYPVPSTSGARPGMPSPTAGCISSMIQSLP